MTRCEVYERLTKYLEKYLMITSLLLKIQQLQKILKIGTHLSKLIFYAQWKKNFLLKYL